MGKSPSHDFHLTVGKFTEDTGDTGACPPPLPPPQLLQDTAHLAEKFLNNMKFLWKREKICKFIYSAIV
jgi:hypothetical protein